MQFLNRKDLEALSKEQRQAEYDKADAEHGKLLEAIANLETEADEVEDYMFDIDTLDDDSPFYDRRCPHCAGSLLE